MRNRLQKFVHGGTLAFVAWSMGFWARKQYERALVKFDYRDAE